MRQIVNHFTDNDLYGFSVMYYVLQTYPDAEVRYSFFDRNHTRYPKGFGALLREQVDNMADVVVTDEEIAYMKDNINFLPAWFYTFLKGYRFNPKEVHIFQDNNGYLTITIEGKWWSSIMWEMPILSTISELMHEINGDMKLVNLENEYHKAYGKGVKAFSNGIVLSDMGTRRRFSFEIQSEVIRALKDANDACKKEESYTGKFAGTSNVWFAMQYGLPCIGTMSHQMISFEECVSGMHQCNNAVMEKWLNVFNGKLLTYLYDCFGDDVFFASVSPKYLKAYDGLRVDSGDEKEQTERIIAKYNYLGIDAKTKKVTYSNALDIDKAIELHKWIDGRIVDLYGIGTHLCADVTNTDMNLKFPYSNIVIKLIAMRLNSGKPWLDSVKLSCDKGKTLGDKKKCDFLLSQIARY